MTDRAVEARTEQPASRRSPRVVVELLLLAALYVGYSALRLFASDDVGAARERALHLLDVESTLRLDVERPLNDLFVQHDWLALAGSYWYATTHYVVTAVVLVWLFRRSPGEYVTARRALVVATLIGLVFYLTYPVAPPRMVDGYVDVLSLTSTDGWWGADASAPKGMGSMTNELAAFPSLHAGWALWVAIVLVRVGAPRLVRAAGLAYAVLMTVDVIGTGNHWLLDAVVGWVVVLVGFGLVSVWQRRDPAPSR